jgi:hypothetical protein
VLLEDILQAKNKQRTVLVNSGIGFASLIGLFINPNGSEGVLFIFNWASKYGYTIVENQSIAFLLPFGFELVNHIILGMILLGVCLGLRLVTKQKLHVGEILLIGIFTLITSLYVRNEIFFAYLAYLISAFSFPDFRNYEKNHRKNTVTISLSFGFFLLLIINFFFHSHQQPLGISSSEKYQSGVTYFQANQLKGPIFNNFDIGGYLIYRLYPAEKVFVDNRPEAYPVSFFQDTYIPMQQDPKVFQAMEEKYHFQTIIWGVEDITNWSQDFLRYMQTNADWKLVYSDGKTAIFSRTKEQIMIR